MARFEIKNYKVSYGSNGLGAFGVVYLYDARGIVGSLVAELSFVDDPSGSNPSFPSPSNPMGPVRLRLPIASFNTVIDLLRNERPIYFDSNRTLNSASITTMREPVGEEES